MVRSSKEALKDYSNRCLNSAEFTDEYGYLLSAFGDLAAENHVNLQLFCSEYAALE